MKFIGVKIKGSVEHFWSSRWGGLNKRTVNGSCPKKTGKIFRDYIKKGIELRITREQFVDWCKQRKELIEGLYKQGEVPSIDRVDPLGHYELNNMRIISLRENRDAGRKARWERYRIIKEFKRAE